MSHLPSHIYTVQQLPAEHHVTVGVFESNKLINTVAISQKPDKDGSWLCTLNVVSPTFGFMLVNGCLTKELLVNRTIPIKDVLTKEVSRFSEPASRVVVCPRVIFTTHHGIIVEHGFVIDYVYLSGDEYAKHDAIFLPKGVLDLDKAERLESPHANEP